jgi:AcrR family transcriptional regulator
MATTPRPPRRRPAAAAASPAPARSRSAKVSAPPKRAYLSRERRRETLLEVAAEIVEKQGWAALSMSALAEQGGTSRQLVYLHFANLEELLAATAWAIFNDTMQDTQAAVKRNPDDLMAAVLAAEAVSLDLRPGRGDALWQLIAGTAAAGPELDKVRRQLRSLITRVWAKPIAEHLRVDEDSARHYAWMLVMSFWGMRQLVRDRKLPREQGMALFSDLVARLLRP